MIGKLIGAYVGGKLAGPNRGGRGAIIGYGTSALARRSMPALAAVGGGLWLARKWRERRRRSNPSYPSEATPSSL